MAAGRKGPAKEDLGTGKLPREAGSGDMAKPPGRLVPLGCARRRACACGLSSPCSAGGLRAGSLARGMTVLGAGFPLRCSQRLSLPGAATLPCAPGGTTGTPEAGPPRSSRTEGGPPVSSDARNR